MNNRAVVTRKIARLAIVAHRKRHLPRAVEQAEIIPKIIQTDPELRGDSAGSPSQSINRALLSQIRQARSELFDLGTPPPYEIEALDRWLMKRTERLVREALYGRRELL